MDPASEIPARVCLDILDRYPEVEQEVSDQDTMFKIRKRYFRTGRTGLDSIRLAMLAIGKTEVGSVLDFPSGYGRVLRWIKAEFPGARLAACDIDQAGVDFCARTFEATPIYGREEPQEIEIEDRYDLVWCGSLFTHLPIERWEGFLDLFEDVLDPGGLLVFTVHGREIALRLRDDEQGRPYMKKPEDREEILRGYETQGAGYRDYAFTDEFREARSLPSSYGISLTKSSWVCALIERRAGLQLTTYMEGQFNGQDTVACVKLPRERKRDTLESLE
jgi:SAM-dependent methyltransferase